MPEILDANGKPYRDPMASLVRDSVRDRGDHVEIDKKALRDLMESRARRMGVQSVPSTPRFMLRDAGGYAVAKGHGRWPHVTLDMLRELRERAPILAPIHQARQYQVQRLCTPWDGTRGHVGIRVVHKDHFEHDAVQPQGFQPYIDRFSKVLWEPAVAYKVPTLSTACEKMMEDLLTINRPVVEKIPAYVDRNRILMWQPVDGGMIWPTLLWAEKWKADNPRWYVGYDQGRLTEDQTLDILSASLDFDLHGAEYCLVRDGILEAVYPRDRLIVAPRENRTDVRFAGYPPSHVEQAMILISAFISTFDYNASYFTKGMLAEFILGLPADLHDDDVDAFVDMFRESTQGTGNAWRPPIIPLPGGKDSITKIDLKAPNKEMQFEIWLSLLLSLTTAVYRMDPSSINAKPWDGGSGPKLSEEGGRAEQIALAREEGLRGDFGHLIATVLNPLAATCHPDLRVVAEYGDYNAKNEADIFEIRGRTDLTRNEIRLANGKKPRGFWLSDDAYETADDATKQKFDDNPWNWPTDPTFASAIAGAKQREQQQQMMSMQQAQGQQPGQDASAGHDDGFGGKNDGFGGNVPGNDPHPYGVPGEGGAPKPPTGPPKPPGPGGPPPGPLAKAVTVYVSER